MAGDPQPKVVQRQQANQARRRKEREFPDFVRTEIMRRAGDRCEVCHYWPITEFHHKLMRSQGGKGTVDNGMGLCVECHHHIHLNPYQSYVKGYLVRVS